MTRNPSDPLNVEDALGRNLLPLGDGLGGHAPERLGKGGGAASSIFRDFTDVFHGPYESISFTGAQAFLSVNESESFDIVRAMTTKGERIKQIRNKMQLTQHEFAAILGGVSRGAVGNWERDQGIKEENIELIAAKTGVAYEWLATGRGSMDPNEIVAPPAAAAVARQFRIPDLAIFGGLGGGGALSVLGSETGVPMNADDLRGYWTFPEYMVRSFRTLEGIYAWEVRGNSMSPTLAGGSVVFVDTNQNRLPPDDIYAIDHGDGLVVKSVQLIAGTDKALVISDNPTYKPVELPRDQIMVYGRVVGWFQWRQ